MGFEINYYNNRFLMFVMDQYANEAEQRGEKPIRLTLGKSELPMHEDITDAMHDAINDYSKSSLVYPVGLPALKERLVKHYYERYNININKENILISLGTSTIFRNIFSLLVTDSEDEVLLPLPYYSLYNFSALLAKAKVRYYKINLDTLQIDYDSFEENFSLKTKLVVINSPGNPLGNIVNEKEMRFIDKTVNGNAYIIYDEIYDNISFDKQPNSAMQLTDKISKTIVTNSFSKGFRMYSRRVGYCIIPNELIEPLTVIQHHTLLTVDPIVQFGAMAALEHMEEVETIKDIYKMRRDYTLKQLKGIHGIRPIMSEGGFYITIDCKEFIERYNFKDGFELAVDIFNKKKVATVPGSDFGLPNTLRLSFSSKRYNEGIDLLKDYFLKKLK